MLTIVLLISLLAAFIILLISKIGLRDYLINNTKGLLQQLLECDFCLGFWIAVCISILAAIILKDHYIVFVPFFSSPITRFLL